MGIVWSLAMIILRARGECMAVVGLQIVGGVEMGVGWLEQIHPS